MTFEELVQKVGIGLAVVIQNEKSGLTQEVLAHLDRFHEWEEVFLHSPPHSQLERTAHQKMGELINSDEDLRKYHIYHPWITIYGDPNHKDLRCPPEETPLFTLEQWSWIWRMNRCAHSNPELRYLAMRQMVALSEK